MNQGQNTFCFTKKGRVNKTKIHPKFEPSWKKKKVLHSHRDFIWHSWHCSRRAQAFVQPWKWQCGPYYSSFLAWAAAAFSSSSQLSSSSSSSLSSSSSSLHFLSFFSSFSLCSSFYFSLICFSANFVIPHISVPNSSIYGSSLVMRKLSKMAPELTCPAHRRRCCYQNTRGCRSLGRSKCPCNLGCQSAGTSTYPCILSSESPVVPNLHPSLHPSPWASYHQGQGCVQAYPIP